MKKLIISVLLVAAVVCVGCQVYLAWNFVQQPSRLEIVFSDEAQLKQAEIALKSYRFEVEDKMLVVKGNKLPIFLGKEVTVILAQEEISDFIILDNSQSVKLAKQSIGIYIFALELIVFVLIARYIFRDAKKAWGKYAVLLETKYPKEIFADNMESYLFLAIKWIFLAMIAIFLGIRMIAFGIYVPPQYVPREYILDFKFYANEIGKASVPAMTQYAQFSRQTLQTLYALSAGNIGICAVMCIIARRRNVHK